tara:strand:+ start:248 stop:1159 length:912 start_codon:yes stop_codon:yes gene_type:complete
MKEIQDQLSWELFYKNSKKSKIKFNKVNEFNRLIAHSKNYFLIAGYGAFTEGYILIITKEFIPSYGLIEEKKLEELRFIISLIKKYHLENFKRLTATFEHGMCACVGGLDRAHLHLMSIDKNTKKKNLNKAINKALYNRKAGVDYIKYNDYKLENLHDINHFFKFGNTKSKTFKVIGKIFKLSDIKNLSVNKWPKITLNHIKKGGHYIYFNCGRGLSSFLTTKNFQTQFGREVVFLNEMDINPKFKKEMNNLVVKKQNNEVWKWQNFIFEKKIIQTMNSSKKFFKKKKEEFYKDFINFQIEVM